MPRRIALVSGPLLSGRYGGSGLAVLHALEALKDTLLVVSKHSTAGEIRRDLQDALPRGSDAPVMLVGGVSTLPFFEIQMAPRVDEDPEVLSDNPYGVPGATTDQAEVALPPRAVGRIPDHPGDDAQSFSRRIRALCGPGPAGAAAGTFYVLGAKVWEKTTQSISAGLDRSIRPDVAPPRVPADFAAAAFIAPDARRHLFNLHGSDREFGWFGQQGKSYPVAIDPQAIAALGARLRNALVVSQACYGGFLLFPRGPRNPAQSCCLQFLELGAAGFLGSTTIAYGGVKGEMNCSDVIAREFLIAASAGVPLGEALLQARNALAASVRSPPGGTQLKTLLQFVLYGDPARVWIEAPPAAKGLDSIMAAGPAAVDPARLAEYSRWDEESVPVAKGITFAAEDADGWQLERAFSAGEAPGAKLGLLPEARAERQLLRSDRQLRDAVAYFREAITYPDGSDFQAESTGGRSLLTLQEQEQGVAPWWRQPVPSRSQTGTKRGKKSPVDPESTRPAHPRPRKSPATQRKVSAGKGTTKRAGGRKGGRRRPVKK